MSVVIKGSSNVNLDFTTGGRITGDFSNATHANRVMFQSSTTNGNTVVGAIPNGTASAGQYAVYSAQDPTNASQGQFLIDSSAGLMSIRSSALGTGTYLPMTFYTGGSERVRIDTSGNVGIGTNSPAGIFSVTTGTNIGAMFTRNAGDNGTAASALNIGTPGGTDTRIGSSGALLFQVGAIGTSAGLQPERARIDTSGNVGIGTSSPATYSSRLVSVSQAGGAAQSLDAPSGTNTSINWYNNGTAKWATQVLPTGEFRWFDFTAAATRLLLDTSGNLGLGVTPSAWNSGVKAFDMSTVGCVAGDAFTTKSVTNAFYNQSGSWIYKTTAGAARFEVERGAFAWHTAPSGTAGNAITFTQAMTLDASGNLGIGTSSPGAKLEVSTGNAALDATSLVLNNTYNNYAAPYNGSTSIVAKGYSYQGFNQNTIGQIQFALDNAFDSGWASSIRLYTSNSRGTVTERMRLDSSGNLLVGTTSFTTGGIQKTIVSAGTASAGFQIQLSGNVGSYIYGYTSGTCGYRVETTSSYPNIQIVSGGTGGVSLSSGATSWASISDERLKTNLLPITDAVEKVCGLRTVTGRYMSDDVSISRAFLIAQDVQAVLPEAVTTIKQKDDDVEYLGLQYTETIPLLVAAIKELKAEFDAYKSTHP